MNVYFEVEPGSVLYQDCFRWLADRKKVVDVFQQIRKKYGIQTTQFYLNSDRLHIEPTRADVTKLRDFLLSREEGKFKVKTPMNEEWREAVKALKVEKPQLFDYFKLYGLRWRERLFSVGDKLYGSIEADGKVELAAYCRTMKASEFYEILEGESGE